MRRLFLINIWLTIFIVNSKAQMLVPHDIESECDEQVYLNIDIEDCNGATGLQFYLTLPEGVTLDSNSDDYGLQLSTLNGWHNYSVELCSTGQLLVVLYSLDQIELSDGVLLRIPLNVGNTPIDTYGRLMNVRTATADATSHLCDEVSFQITTSKKITFADAKVKALCVQNWDTNGNGELSESEAAAVTSLGTVFRGNTEITSFEELRYFTGLTEICDSAFFNCTSLASVSIPENVTSSGRFSFLGCTGLTKAEFASIESLCGIEFETSSSNPLQYAHHLYIDGEEITNLVIPTSVTLIKDHTFVNCSSLNSVTFHDGITSSGFGCFVGCSNLSEIDIPNGLQTISECMFADCIGLTNVVIPEGVEIIGDQAFRGCTSLNHIVIPETVTSIESQAFGGCGTLSVTIYVETPPAITSFVFLNTVRDTLYVPKGCKAAYEAANIWKKFKVIIEMDDPSIISFADANVKAICVANWDTNGDGELNEEEASTVADLGTVFKGNTEITSFNELQYFTGLTEIPREAFMGCSNLTSVVIADNVTQIGYSAFDDCYALSSVNLPSTITFIDGAAFSDCRSLTSITLPEGIPSIGDWFFDNCIGLTEVVIPSSVTSIGQSAFSGCTNLVNVTLPEELTSIGKEAFMNCNAFTSIVIPASVTSIGHSAFAKCPNVTSVDVEEGNTIYDSRNNCNAIIETATNKLISGCPNTVIPEDVAVIGEYAFRDCTGLTEIVLPNSVTSIGERAFQNCSDLVSVTMPASVISFSGIYSFGESNNIESVYITDLSKWLQTDFNNGNNPLRSGAKLYLNNEEVKDLAIPEGTTTILPSAFEGCESLISVTIPSSVTSINSYSFSDCSNLIMVTVNAETPIAITSNVFSNRANATLIVPYGCKDAYEAADYWRDFKEIIEIVPDDHIEVGDDLTDKTKFGEKYLKNPDFQSERGCLYGWTDQSQKTPSFYDGYPDVLECWNGNFNISQEVRLPRDGAYRLQTRAFYRTGNVDVAYSRWIEANGQNIGDNKSCAFLYAGNLTSPIANVMNTIYTLEEVEAIGAFYDTERLQTGNNGGQFTTSNNLNPWESPYDFLQMNGEDAYTPGGVFSASYVFNCYRGYDKNSALEDIAQNYTSFIDFIGEAGEVVRMGVKAENILSEGWTIFAPYHLYYKGNDPAVMLPVMEETINLANDLANEPMAADSLNALNAAITAAENAENSEDLIAAYKAIDAAFGPAKTSAAIYKTLADANADLEQTLADRADKASEEAKNNAFEQIRVVKGILQDGSVADADIPAEIEYLNYLKRELFRPIPGVYPADYTEFALKNPRFQKGWTGWEHTSHTSIENQNVLVNGDTQRWGIAEGWNNAEFGFDIYQIVTDLPEGVWEVRAQGLARLMDNSGNMTLGFGTQNPDEIAGLYEVYADNIAKLYANNDEVFLANPYLVPAAANNIEIMKDNNGGVGSWYEMVDEASDPDHPTSYFIPNDRKTFASRLGIDWYDADGNIDPEGKWYENVVVTYVDESGELRLGWRCDNCKANSWAPATNFRIIYHGPQTIPGDVNNDGTVNIPDVTALVNIILGKDNAVPYLYDHIAADVNGDGSVSIEDVTLLVNIILGKQ